MKRLTFDDSFALADTMIAKLTGCDKDCPLIAAYGKYEVIKELLESLIMCNVTIANEIELQDYDVAHYDKEYVLYLSNNGINVEKIFVDGHYIYECGTVSFVHEDCNSKLLPFVKSKNIFEFGYINYDDIEDEYDCCECDLGECIYCDEYIHHGELAQYDQSERLVNLSKDKDGDLHGFSANKSDGDSYFGYSFYTSGKLDMDDIRGLLKDMGF